MQIFLDNFHKGGKYSAQKARQQTELRREEFFDQKSLSISDLQIDYLNLDNAVRNNEREIFSQSRCIHCGGSKLTKKRFKQQIKEKGHNKSTFNSCNSNNKRTEHNC